MNAPVMLTGHVLDVLPTLPDESVNCIVTSVPYWGLRDYGIPPVVWGGDKECSHDWGEPLIGKTQSGGLGGSTLQGSGPGLERRATWESNTCSKCGAWLGCLGLEPTPQLFVSHIVQVFREVRRVLRKDGTCWVNIGDTYASSGGDHSKYQNNQPGVGAAKVHNNGHGEKGCRRAPTGLKPKDRCMIPARVAIALCDDGWYLRDEIIWNKPNPMPSSVTDRTTPAHEMIYLLTKSKRYWYDAEAIKEPVSGNAHARGDGVNPKAKPHFPGPNSRVHVNHAPRSGTPQSRQNESFSAAVCGLVDTRNKRSVWTIATQPYPEAHFATFPEELPKVCILAGCPEGGVVMDPFGGSGTTIAVALSLGRDGIYIDQSEEYTALARRRIGGVTPGMRFEVSA